MMTAFGKSLLRCCPNEPENKLWCAVIERQARDAIGVVCGHYSDQNQRMMRRDGEDFFFGSDLRYCSLNAGTDPDTVRDLLTRGLRELARIGRLDRVRELLIVANGIADDMEDDELREACARLRR